MEEGAIAEVVASGILACPDDDFGPERSPTRDSSRRIDDALVAHRLRFIERKQGLTAPKRRKLTRETCVTDEEVVSLYLQNCGYAMLEEKGSEQAWCASSA
eukprot:4134201-Alexandrium_andersonii.AAC.1